MNKIPPAHRMLQRLSSLPPDGRYALSVRFKVSSLQHILQHQAIPNDLAAADVIAKMLDDIVKDDKKAHR